MVATLEQEYSGGATPNFGLFLRTWIQSLTRRENVTLANFNFGFTLLTNLFGVEIFVNIFEPGLVVG